MQVDKFDKQIDCEGMPWFFARYPTPTEREHSDERNSDEVAHDPFNLHRPRHKDKVGNFMQMQHRRCVVFFVLFSV